MGAREWIKEEEAAVASWNAKHPIGTTVRVMRDRGGAVQTTTASGAFMLSGHTAVVQLNGISGCYALDRCTPIAEDKVLVQRDKLLSLVKRALASQQMCGGIWAADAQAVINEVEAR